MNRFKKTLTSVAVTLTALGGAALATGTAHASDNGDGARAVLVADTSPTPVLATLYAAKDGSAAWAKSKAVLDNGTSGAAYVDMQGLGGSTAPTTAPDFTASNDAAGAVRWVVEFHNGDYLFGSGSGSDAHATSWNCNPGGAATDYATALKACQPGYDDWVTAAFIVYDQSANLGPVTLSGMSYGGQPVEAQVALSGGHVVSGTLSNNRVSVAWTATPTAMQYAVTLNGPNFYDHVFAPISVTQANFTGLAAGHGYTVYVTPEDGDGNPVGPTGHIWFVTPHVG